MTADSRQSVRDHIFISYRRDDARGASGRLYDWLRIGFGREHVFRDVHSIGVGKWRDKIDAALARSAVCVAVIGPRRANVDNLPRLQGEGDMMRHKLVTALGSNAITLVPRWSKGSKSRTCRRRSCHRSCGRCSPCGTLAKLPRTGGRTIRAASFPRLLRPAGCRWVPTSTPYCATQPLRSSAWWNLSRRAIYSPTTSTRCAEPSKS